MQLSIVEYCSLSVPCVVLIKVGVAFKVPIGAAFCPLYCQVWHSSSNWSSFLSPLLPSVAFKVPIGAAFCPLYCQLWHSRSQLELLSVPYTARCGIQGSNWSCFLSLILPSVAFKVPIGAAFCPLYCQVWNSRFQLELLSVPYTAKCGIQGPIGAALCPLYC